VFSEPFWNRAGGGPFVVDDPVNGGAADAVKHHVEHLQVIHSVPFRTGRIRGSGHSRISLRAPWQMKLLHKLTQKPQNPPKRRADECPAWLLPIKSHNRFRISTLPGRQVDMGVSPTLDF